MSLTGNSLLDSLPQNDVNFLLESSRTVDLPRRTVLISSDQAPTYLYLLTRGAASTIITMANGGCVEVGMVGNAGLVGAATLLGPGLPQASSFMQLSGSGLRVPTKALRRLFEDSASFRNRTLEFLQAQMNVTGQICACNRLHEAEPRLARWLLTCSDRVHSDTLGLTQETLAQMLGTQRTTVALVAGVMQRAGLIDYSRGSLRIADRSGLVSIACDCYEIICRSLATLYAEKDFSIANPRHFFLLDEDTSPF